MNRFLILPVIVFTLVAGIFSTPLQALGAAISSTALTPQNGWTCDVGLSHCTNTTQGLTAECRSVVTGRFTSTACTTSLLSAQQSSTQQPTPPSTQQGGQPALLTNTQQQSQPSGPDFQPLTTIPGIREAAQSQNLAAFLDTLYKLCIGIAAVLAIVQILRGGITYMLGDSVTEKRDAKHHIYMALFGLLLVLSPAIIFGIIDSRILNLNINVSRLAPSAGTGSGNLQGTPGTETQGTPGNSNGTPQAPQEPDTSTQEGCEAAGGGWRDGQCVFIDIEIEDPETEVPITEGTWAPLASAAYALAPRGTVATAFTVPYQIPNGPSCNLVCVKHFDSINPSTDRTACQSWNPRTGSVFARCFASRTTYTVSNTCAVMQNGELRAFAPVATDSVYSSHCPN